MPCRQVSTFNGTAASSGSYRTEAECNQACKEGACCEGTTCTVKPQCQCVPSGVCCGPDTVDVSGTSAPRCRSESESQCIQRGGTWVVGGNCVRDEKTGAAGAWCAALTGTPNKVFQGVGTTCAAGPCGCCGNGETIAGKMATIVVSTDSLPTARWCAGGNGFVGCPNGQTYNGCWAQKPCEDPAFGAWIDTAASLSATFTSNASASNCTASLQGSCPGYAGSRTASVGFSSSPCKIYATVDCPSLIAATASGSSVSPYWAWTYDPQASEYNALYYVFQYIDGTGANTVTQSVTSTPVSPSIPTGSGASWFLSKTVTVNMRLTLA
jgi:hypothetical protein